MGQSSNLEAYVHIKRTRGENTLASAANVTAQTVSQEDPAAILDIKEDIRDECSKLGEVTNVVLFDKEQEGVASVRFSTPEAAIACVKVCRTHLFYMS